MLRPTFRKLFFKILRKNFPKTNLLPKILNKHTVKISYGCTRKVNSIISGHGKQMLHPKPQQYGCNWRDKNNCPPDNKCLTQQIVYQADVTNDTDDIYRYYLGLAETSFKYKCRNHILIKNSNKIKQNCLIMFGLLRMRIKLQ